MFLIVKITAQIKKTKSIEDQIKSFQLMTSINYRMKGSPFVTCPSKFLTPNEQYHYLYFP